MAWNNGCIYEHFKVASGQGRCGCDKVQGSKPTKIIGSGMKGIQF